MDNNRVCWQWNVPNLLSVLRILLIPIFCIAYFWNKTPGGSFVAGAVLVCSGMTDMLDGHLARKYHQITEIGKIIDPFADKLTQVTVCVCIGIKKPEFLILLGLFMIKEVAMLIGGYLLLRRNHKLAGAQWFGKVNTIVFYIVMIMLIFFPALPPWLQWAMIGTSSCFMVLSFFMYLWQFFQSIRCAGTPSHSQRQKFS